MIADAMAPEQPVSRPVQVRLAEWHESTRVAEVHHEALPDDFLPSLGLDFLSRVYYPAAFASQNAANLVAVADSQIVGFVTIAHDTDGFSRDVLRSKALQIAGYALRAAVRRPRHLFTSAEVLWSVLSSRPDPLKGEIVLIAVDGRHRGRGVGKALVSASVAYLARHGVAQCRTKTLASNVGVIAMYEGLGWRIRDRFRLIGRDYVTLVSSGAAESGG